MRTSFARIAGLIAAALLCTGDVFASDAGPQQFDLICQGMVMDPPVWRGSSDSTPFTTRFQVDLQKNMFCVDDYCSVFTRADKSRLEYHCQIVAGGKFCGSVNVGTAGPYIEKQDFVIDRSTGSFQRTSSGWIGDRASRPFNAAYSGDCAIGPFTGLPKAGDGGQ
jgi:hypothetical protein